MGKRKHKFELTDIIKYVERYFGHLMSKGLYIILLLFFAYKSDATPGWARKIIIGSLAYFLSPFDSIPDLTPFLGMTDDIGVLSFGLVTIACYVDEDVRLNAYVKLKLMMGSKINDKMISEVNSWL